MYNIKLYDVIIKYNPIGCILIIKLCELKYFNNLNIIIYVYIQIIFYTIYIIIL